MLPEMNGFEVMEQINNCGTPVIFLTAMQNVTDKVRGLRLGAEDYIVKPFEALELLARIDVVLRRSNKTQNIMNYENIVVDINKHLITLNGEPIQLTPKEFDVLVYFLQHTDIAFYSIYKVSFKMFVFIYSMILFTFNNKPVTVIQQSD